MRMDTYYEKQHTNGQPRLFSIYNDGNSRGVKAGLDLKTGTVICNISGPSLSYGQALLMVRHEVGYLQTGLFEYIEPCHPFPLFQHSCDPNCALNCDFQFVSIKDIRMGEELCWDYSTSMLERGLKQICNCRTQNCRKEITDFDLLPREVQGNYLHRKLTLPYIKAYLENIKTINS